MRFLISSGVLPSAAKIALKSGDLLRPSGHSSATSPVNIAGWNQVTAKPLASPAPACAANAIEAAITAAEQNPNRTRAMPCLPSSRAPLERRDEQQFSLAEISHEMKGSRNERIPQEAVPARVSLTDTPQAVSALTRRWRSPA